MSAAAQQSPGTSKVPACPPEPESLPCPALLGCCWQEKNGTFFVNSIQSSFALQESSVFASHGPLFILFGLKFFLGGRVWFWAVSVQGRQHKGMLCLPGCAHMNR